MRRVKVLWLKRLGYNVRAAAEELDEHPTQVQRDVKYWRGK